MNMQSSALVTCVGMVTPVGLTAASSAAAIRAGIVRFKETPLLSKRGQPIVMALLPDEHLPTLSIDRPWFKSLPFTKQERVARTLRLGGLALRECAQRTSCCASIPVLLALPDEPALIELHESQHLLQSLASQSGVMFDLARSRVVQRGRAGGFVLLQEAMNLIRAQPEQQVFIGGIDTYLDLNRLHNLETEGRLRVDGRAEGLIPGEAAAFVLCSSARCQIQSRPTALASIYAVGIGAETAHRYTTQPCLSHGFTAALGALWTTAGCQESLVQSVLVGFSGERDQANEWAVAMIRHRSHLSDMLSLTHPADCIGDVGAAMGPLLICLGALSIQRGYRHPPCVIGCASDRELRGVALLGSLSDSSS